MVFLLIRPLSHRRLSRLSSVPQACVCNVALGKAEGVGLDRRGWGARLATVRINGWRARAWHGSSDGRDGPSRSCEQGGGRLLPRARKPLACMSFLTRSLPARSFRAASSRQIRGQPSAPFISKKWRGCEPANQCRSADPSRAMWAQAPRRRPFSGASDIARSR